VALAIFLRFWIIAGGEELGAAHERCNSMRKKNALENGRKDRFKDNSRAGARDGGDGRRVKFAEEIRGERGVIDVGSSAVVSLHSLKCTSHGLAVGSIRTQ